MSIIRDVGVTVNALADTIFVTCSALMSTAGTTAATGMLSVNTTADAIAGGSAETTAYGRVIDRLSAPLGENYMVAMPCASLYSSRGSTEADRKITLGIKLQHGDSSGGGDMSDYTTASQRADAVYFSSARSSEYRTWDATLSTGALAAFSLPTYYDLRAAKRFIRVAVPVFKNRVTTESSGDEQSRLSASLTLLGGEDVPQTVPPLRSAYTTSTST